jgi:hypothetical protein
MELLKSSIIGKEFVNYRKSTMTVDRQRFSERVRREGVGKANNYREKRFGRELVFHMDQTVTHVLKQIKIIFMQEDKEASTVE